MKNSTLIGKTIKSIDDKYASNIIRIKFTDDTEIVIDTEPIGYGLYTPIFMEPKGYNFVGEPQLGVA